MNNNPLDFRAAARESLTRAKELLSANDPHHLRYAALELRDAMEAHYDAIGSYLHMPSLDQIQTKRLPDIARLRKRCEALVSAIDQVLSSRIWNSTFGVTTTLDQCMNEDCKKPVRKRMPHGKDTYGVQCFECKAEYTVTKEDDGRVLWTPKKTDAPCSTSSCAEKIALWPHEVKAGTHWHCQRCGVHNRIELAVLKIDSDRPTS